MSLYRTYRPKDFVSLIGQEHIKTTLLNAIKSNRVSHAYLFTGPRGTGKTTTARLLSKAINAEKVNDNGTFEPSEILDEIEAGKLIDIIEIDAASNRGIDEMRDLREKINFAPTRTKNKVYIIDEVHMLTKEAFNALLKTLEEPPSFVYFVLATTEITKVPETIISRCQRFDFRRITLNDLIGRLKEIAKIEKIETEDEALMIIAKHARGGLRDALGLMEQVIKNGKILKSNVEKILGMAQFQVVEELTRLIEQGNAAEGLKRIGELHQTGVDLTVFNKDILEYLRQQMLTEVGKGNLEKVNRLVKVIEMFQESYEKLRYSYIAELPLELATVKAAMLNSSNGIIKITTDINLDNNISSDEILKKWTEVVSRIHNPVIKRTVQSGQVTEIKNGLLILTFPSDFHQNKFNNAEYKNALERHLENEYKVRLKVQTEVDTELVIKKVEPIKSLTADSHVNNVANDLAEMFDGEVVE